MNGTTEGLVPHGATEGLAPQRYRVVGRREETADTVTLTLQPVDPPLPVFRPGQFAMVYAFGVGEVPLSASGRDGGAGIRHTLRAVGAVTRALHDARPGDVLGVRGPFGTDWRLPAPPGADLVIVGGGIGLAPLRPVIEHAIAHRDRYRRVLVLLGARTPGDLLYRDEYQAWRTVGVQVCVTVDRADAGWSGAVGLVTTLVDQAGTDPGRTVGFLCGPEAMMRAVARALIQRGTPEAAIRVSLERNMKCGTGHCGHCQLGPLLLCLDGPVVGYDTAARLLHTREL